MMYVKMLKLRHDEMNLYMLMVLKMAEKNPEVKDKEDIIGNIKKTIGSALKKVTVMQDYVKDGYKALDKGKKDKIEVKVKKIYEGVWEYFDDSSKETMYQSEFFTQINSLEQGKDIIYFSDLVKVEDSYKVIMTDLTRLNTIMTLKWQL